MKIKIDLDGDLSQAISQLNELKAKIEEFPGYLAEEAVENVTEPLYEGHPVNTSVSKSNGEAVITANGDQIGFVEYGTGCGAVYDSEAPVPTGYGAWSGSPEGRQILINKGYWYYNKQRQYGEQAAQAMTKTSLHLKINAHKEAQGYFK